MLLVNTYIAPSDIEGVGVFAAEPIRAGTLVWRLDPDFDRLIPASDYDCAPPHLKTLFDRYAYPSPDRPGFRVYEVDNGRFMNHSESPNTDFPPTGGGTASRDIAAGEELTCDYRQFYEGHVLHPPLSGSRGSGRTKARSVEAGVAAGRNQSSRRRRGARGTAARRPARHGAAP